MRLPASHSHTTMNCEQDFVDGGLGVTLTLRLLMHGKVGGCSHCLPVYIYIFPPRLYKLYTCIIELMNNKMFLLVLKKFPLVL